LTLFDSAFRIAPTKAMEDIAREAKAEALFDQMDRETAPGPEFYASQIRALDVKKYHRKLAGYGKVEIQTQPIGAAVYCFRYENFEERLTPLPFDPVRGYKSAEDGVLAGPALFVEDVFATDRNIPFQSNDEILRVDGQSVEMRSDFARVLENIKVGQEIEVQLRRHGRSRPFPWVPFPKANSSPTETQAITDEDVRIRGIRATFGFSFRTYPLRFLESNRLGMTSTDNPLIADLPRGSYLFVIRKDGYRDTRLPITAPRVKEDGAIETVRLFRDEEIPNGFVQVAGGVFPHGKDREADQALPAGTTSVDDFFIQRHEVTMKEWLDFVTDPGVLPTLDELGRGIPNWTRPDLAPFVPESVREQLRDEERKRLEDLQKDQKAESTSPIKPFEGGQERVSFLPLFRNSDPLFDFENGTYQIKESLEEDYPVLGISHIAAVEFAAWYTRKHGQGRWIFRVPNDLQWEKAARGRDSRYHVWGNYFIPSYCWGHDARRPDDPLNLRPVGYVPSDESVYDVRDMAGSATELTLGLTDDVGRYGAWRGGSWRTATQYFFRIANRNGRQPWDSWHDTGLRLVAEPVSPTKLEQ
jgi:formylglycine-generating enzyme required for sulfatase activity